jgi:hypothetical protein
MQEAFGIVIFAVVGISVVLALVSLFFRNRTYDEIGRGGIGEGSSTAQGADVDGSTTAQGADVDLATTAQGAVVERGAEIRQMLEARNARRVARGEAPVDVEDELARLTAPAVDPALREEVRELVIARNARREAKGQPPLDVDAEVERQLKELGG